MDRESGSPKQDLERAQAILIELRGLDPSNAEVTAILSRIDARLAAIGHAEREEAEDVVRKSRLVAAVLQRWTRLESGLRVREGFHYDSRAEKRPRTPWPELDLFMRETPSDRESRSAMKAFAGWGARMDGREPEGLRWMEEAIALGPEHPYGHLMKALVLFAQYLDLLPPLSNWEGPTGLLFYGPPRETDAMARLREEIRKLLDRATQARIWGRESSASFRAAIDAILAMQRGSYTEAERILGRTLEGTEMTAFETGFRFARGIVRYRLKRFREAAEDLRKVLEVRPFHAGTHSMLGTVLSGEASEGSVDGRDVTRIVEEALAAYDKAVDLDPGAREYYSHRASVRVLQAARGDAQSCYDLALQDYERAIRIDPQWCIAYGNRGRIFGKIGELEAAQGRDPVPWYEKAVTDCAHALALNASYALPRANRAAARLAWAEWEASRGLDPRPRIREAIADVDILLHLSPQFAEGYLNRGGALQELGIAQDRRGIDPRAAYRRSLSDLETAIRLRPRMTPAYHTRADTRMHLGEEESGIRSGLPQPRTRALAQRRVRAGAGRGSSPIVRAGDRGLR